jgi:hypothetical protein
MRVALCALSLASSLASATEPADSFARLKTLVGDWQAPAGPRVSFRLVANESVLVQTFVTASGSETLTLFHLDAGRLLATHYCAQGNQPRLALDPASTGARMSFRFVDATNLRAPSTAHLVRLELLLEAGDRYTEVETYEEAGKPEVTTLKFRRVK